MSPPPGFTASTNAANSAPYRARQAAGYSHAAHLISRLMRVAVSRVLQSADGRLHYLVQAGQLLFQISLAGGRQGVRLAAVLRGNWGNPALLCKAGDRPVERPRPQPHVGEALDILHHGVAVLIAGGQAGKYE